MDCCLPATVWPLSADSVLEPQLGHMDIIVKAPHAIHLFTTGLPASPLLEEREGMAPKRALCGFVSFFCIQAINNERGWD